MPNKKENLTQQVFKFAKQRKYPIEVLKARLTNLKIIKNMRLLAKQEENYYLSHVTYLHTQIGTPHAIDSKRYIQKVRDKIEQENKIASGFTSSGDVDAQKTHEERAEHYKRYARTLEIVTQKKKNKPF